MSNVPKPLVIPIFTPHSGCPHQCAFCNQKVITSETHVLPGRDRIKEVITSYLAYKGKRNRVELAFFGGNFLGLDSEYISNALSFVQTYVDQGKIDSIRFSTRPDTISQKNLDMISAFSVSTVELGVQSMDDRVLSLSKRGHTSQDTVDAVGLLKDHHKKIGVQLMTGLSGDSRDTACQTAEKVISLHPDFIRIYPLIVLKGSLLAEWFEKETYTPPTLDESVQLVKQLFLKFNKANIPVIRMGLQSSDLFEEEGTVLAGPWHPAFGHLVISSVFFDTACELLEKQDNLHERKKATLLVHPVSESRLRGDKNSNLKQLKQKYPWLDLSISKDPEISEDQLSLYLG